MYRKLLLIVVMVALTLSVGTNAARAGQETVSGTFDTVSHLLTHDQPVMKVISINTPPDCFALGTIDVRYHAYPFTVDADGVYNFTQTFTDGAAGFYLFEGSFDPANGFPTCIAGVIGLSPNSADIALTAGTQYFAVAFDNSSRQVGVSYTLTIYGSGSILFPEPPVLIDPCLFPMPSNAVVYDVPAGAPAFYEPSLSAGANFNLPAGTWKISETSGDSSKVWIACSANPVWIPTNAVGALVG